MLTLKHSACLLISPPSSSNREVSVCPQTLSRGMLRRTFHYDDSSMYAAMGDINYLAKSIVPGKNKRLAGESVSLRVSD